MNRIRFLKDSIILKYLPVLLAFMIFGCLNLIAQKQGQAKLDSMIAELKTIRSDTSKVSLLEKISFEFYSTDPKSGMKYGNEGLELAKELKWKEGIANCNNALGANCFSLGNYSEALKKWQTSLKLNEEMGNKYAMTGNLGNIGVVYQKISDYDKAIEYIKKTLSLYEELGDKHGVARNLGNIGTIYDDIKELDKALEYYKKALIIDEELGLKKDIAADLGNIANVYSDKDQFIEALDYYHRTVEIYEELGNQTGIVRNYGNLGNIYYILARNFKKYNEEGKILDKNMSKNYCFDQSIKLSTKAVELGEKYKLKPLLTLPYKTLKNVFKEKNDYKKAFYYQSKQMAVNNSIFNDNNSREIGKLEAEREQLEKEYIEKDKARKISEETSYRNNIQYSAIAILILLLFISMMIIPKINIPNTLTDAIVFITFLLFYELMLVISEPMVDNLTNNIPIYKLGINIFIALLFIPFHNIEKKLRLKYSAKYSAINKDKNS